MKSHCLLLLLVFPIFVKAQNTPLLKTYDHKKLEGNSLKVYAENGLINLDVIKVNLVKISYLKTDSAIIIDKEKQAKTPINIRVTQNLDDIFLFTDSLIIIVNKIDFSIKFEKRNEELLVLNHPVFVDNNEKISAFELADSECFYNVKHRILKAKQYKLKSETTPLKSSKNYALVFESSKNYGLNYRKANQQQLQYFTKNNLSYYFVLGDVAMFLKN